jgi:uncharacterized OB-fold protein
MSEQRPNPRINSINRPFWEGCSSGELRLQRCLDKACRKWVYFPRVCCPHCGGGDLAWETASGRGAIVSFTVVRRPQHPSFFPDAPYVFAAIRLAEGPLMYSRIEDVPVDAPDLLHREVEVTFAAHTPTQKLPFFRLAQS